ncbi:MAG TPA: IPT/TIG domain-containing protein, partial [Acidimicrobiales bacterium]|nr:IPT/TIG domain-containing protein [Acidimicrobiales bacterium]
MPTHGVPCVLPTTRRPVTSFPAPAAWYPFRRRPRRGGASVAAFALSVGLVAAPVATLLVTSSPASAAGAVATVTAVSPVSGAQGGTNTVTVTGTNLGSTGTTIVDFGMSSVGPAGVTVNSTGTSLTVAAPANPNATGRTTFGSTFDVTVN